MPNMRCTTGKVPGDWPRQPSSVSECPPAQAYRENPYGDCAVENDKLFDIKNNLCTIRATLKPIFGRVLEAVTTYLRRH